VQANLRRQPPVEISEPIGTEPLDLRQCRGRVLEKRLDVHTLTPRRERREVARAPCQHVHGAVMVAAAKMVEGDADLQDSLIQPAHVTPFGSPQQLQRLVLLEVLAGIELRDARQQHGRRRFLARRHGLDPYTVHDEDSVSQVLSYEVWPGV
jgi:hypothetical protein